MQDAGRGTEVRLVKWLILLFLFGFLLWAVAWPRSPKLVAQTTIKRSSSAIAVTADGALYLAVNPDSNSLSLIDTSAQEKIAEIPVGLDPRTVAADDAGGRAYVANRGSDSVSVVDLTARTVITEVVVGGRPC